MELLIVDVSFHKMLPKILAYLCLVIYCFCKNNNRTDFLTAPYKTRDGMISGRLSAWDRCIDRPAGCHQSHRGRVMRLTFTICLALIAVEFCIMETPLDVLKTSKDEAMCYPFEEYRAPGTLYTGNSSMGNVPILQYKVSELTSFDCEFELRTLDPEGIIFHGDIYGVNNWLLAVQKRHLTMQSSHGDGRVIVSAGPLISDGQWKRIMLTMREMGVSISVDGEQVISVQQSTESHNVELGDGYLRIAIGASLPNSISTGINAPLDACMQNWDWVKQDSSVLLQDSHTQRCWDRIAPGSFFPGSGHVGFLPQTLGNATAEGKGSSWTLVVELAFRPVEDRGVLFAIVDPHNSVSFSLSLNQLTKDLVLHLKNREFGSSSTPPSLCLGESQFLQLQVKAGQVMTELGGERVVRRLENKDFHYLRGVWSQPRSMVFLGGLPGDAFSFRGCLQAKVQGVEVDLDLAEVKNGDIRSHSCPSGLDLRGK